MVTNIVYTRIITPRWVINSPALPRGAGAEIQNSASYNVCPQTIQYTC